MKSRKKGKRRSHRVEGDNVKDISSSTDLVPVNLPTEPVQFTAERSKPVPIRNKYEMIKQKERSEIDPNLEVVINIDEGSAAKWKKGDIEDLTTHEVVSILSQVYPNITDHYVLYRHADARGYEIREADQTIIVRNGEIIDNFTSDKNWREDVDFIFVEADNQDSVAELLREKELIQMQLPVYNKHKRNELGEKINNSYGQSYVIAVLSDSGKIYGLRVNSVEMTLDNKVDLRLQRTKTVKGDAEVIETKRLYNKSKPRRLPQRGVALDEV